MNSVSVSLLKCPICGTDMRMDDAQRSCFCDGARRHCYDVARSGYLNLAMPSDGEGDLKAAVAARRLFLESGYYSKLSDAVNGWLDSLCASVVLDAGCGEGYYTNRMATDRDALGIDLSRSGIDLAARYAKQHATRASFAVGNLFALPIRDSSVDVVVNLFAPCAESEFSRVLRHKGHLLLVGAGERHLFGLKEALYEKPYLNAGRADLPTGMTLIQHQRITDTICVRGREQIDALFSMTPYYWRTFDADREKLKSIDELYTEIDFAIYLFEKGENL